MSWRGWTTGILVLALLTLCPVASASPIDPTWIAGFWDDGDYDNVVIWVTSMASAADMKLVVALVSLLVFVSVTTLEPESFGARMFSQTTSRAPPVTA
jgi:hypothetical protein